MIPRRLLPLVVAALLNLSLQAATTEEPRPDLTLSSGEVLKAARIVAINGDSVTVVHAEGSTLVAADLVDLEVLARAKMALAQVEAERRERAERATKVAAERLAQEKEDAKDRITAARLAAAVRQQERETRPIRDVPQASLIALKQAFPAKAVGQARVFIPRSGHGGRPHLLASTAGELHGGTPVAAARVRSVGSGRVDSIQYEAPAEDMWRWYKGMFQTATIEGLPRTLQMVEARMAEDIAKCRTQLDAYSASGQAQAQHSLYWFEKQLRPHLAEWRKLLR